MTILRSRFPCLILGTTLAVAVGAVVGLAQDDGRIEVVWKDKNSEESTINKIRSGDIAWNSAAHTPLLEHLARYRIYRLTWPENQKRSVLGNNTTAGRAINDLWNEFDRTLPDYKSALRKDPDKSRKQRTFVEEYTRQAVPCIEKVLKHNDNMARITAARMLARLAEYGNEELCDPLAAVMEDTAQIDAAKYWAAVGMKNLFAGILPERIRKEDKELRIVQAALAFIQRPSPLPTDASPQNVAGFHYVRRAFIAALGSGPRPLIVQGRNQVAAQPALELVRIVSKEGLKPAPTLTERLEAVVGLSNLQRKWYENYQADYAAQHAGYFLLDFFAAYNDERQQPIPIKREPWKIHAMRLKEALQKMLADSKNNPYVDNVQRRVDGFLDLVIKSEAVSVNPFSDWLRANPPPSGSLYKGDAKAVVKLSRLES